MTRRPSRQSGFSLAELLITALIFGIGLLGLAALQVTTLRSNSGGRNRITAASLAEGCMSSIQAEGSLSWTISAKSLGTAAVWAGARTYTGGTTNGTFGTFDVNGQPPLTSGLPAVFTVTWTRRAASTATPSAAITGMNMNEFVVVVSWQDEAIAANGAVMPPSTLTLSRLIRYGV